MTERVVDGLGYKCAVGTCTSEIGLQIHHIDEDPSNNAPANLLLLCANHHSLATEGKMDRKACRDIKRRLARRNAPPTVDHERLAKLLIAQLSEFEGWPKALKMKSLSLKDVAVRIEAEVGARVELLARFEKERLFLWVRSPGWSFAQVKAVLVAVACLVSADDARNLEIGFSDTSDLQFTVGGGGIGQWRALIELSAAAEVANSGKITSDFWTRAAVLITAGDNVRVGQVRMPFAEFEAQP